VSKDPASLTQWLDRLQQLHPNDIELGLDRVHVVAQRMGLDLSRCQVVIVAGTNGKGSTIAALQAIALRHGWSVGTYTSPHLLRFNERIQIDGEPLEDAQLCHAFAAVEAQRSDVPLTYFEFTTLAALYCLQQYQPHLCLLEVGLGGRLDAVNIIDADIAVVTNIQLDHQQYLGDDRESIALEKAGIFRPGVPAICAEYQAPSNLRRSAADIGAHWFQVGHDFDVQLDEQSWRWSGVDATGAVQTFVSDGLPLLQSQAVAAAMQAACLLLPDPQPALLMGAAASARLAGRCQCIDIDGCTVVLDVAHNEAAAQRLAQFLDDHPVRGCTHLVLALMQDKPAYEIVESLAPVISGRWYLPELAVDRARPAQSLADLTAAHEPLVSLSVAAAVADCLASAQSGDRVVVTGSFYTVADALRLLQEWELDIE
jgi:dihydrofolate synthase/folylpolyglutamate synthase